MTNYQEIEIQLPMNQIRKSGFSVSKIHYLCNDINSHGCMYENRKCKQKVRCLKTDTTVYKNQLVCTVMKVCTKL